MRPRKMPTYLTDYRTETVTDKKGKTKKTVVYIGPVIRVITEKSACRLKCIYALCEGLVLTIALLLAEFIQHFSFNCPYVILPLAVAIAPWMYMVSAYFRLPFAKSELTRDLYLKGIIRVFKCCGVIIPLAGVAFIGDFIYRAIQKDWSYFKEDIWFLLILALVIISALAIIFTLRSIEFDERELIETQEREKAERQNKKK